MKKALSILILCLFLFVFYTNGASANTASELQQKIAETQKQRDALQEEQKKLQAELEAIGQSKNNLQNNIKQLDATKAKLNNDIKLTQTKINGANLNIQALQDSMDEKQNQIEIHENAIGNAIKQMANYDSNSLITDLLNDKNLSEVWADRGTLESIENKLVSEISLLQDAQKVLNQKKEEKEKTKNELVGLKTELGGQKAVVETTQANKNKLLAQTKGQEAAYQKLLADNIALQAKFEAEQFLYESQLKVTLDPSSVPAGRKGILVWPLSKIAVTQNFGAGAAAKRLYVSGTHGGVDFRASLGTPVFASLGGTVTDTEGVRFKQGCQYGKWVLIKHPNGLSTIYGHLSQVVVVPGQTLETGQIIGYSGATGYSTGPHLHMGLYISAGIKIVDSSSLGSKNCSGIKTVAAPPQAYLDPLAYLPPLN
jgi:murein DD-endopeptidase MepM/ murein hydrolase activator NlpD